MRKVLLDDIRPGMVLEQDLAGSNGRFLLEKGTVLTEKHIRVMHIWGVLEADVLGTEGEEWNEDAEVVPQEVKLAALAQVDALFVCADKEDEFTRELHKLVWARKVEILCQVGKQSAPPVGRELLEEPTPVGLRPQELVEKEIKLTSFPDIYFQILDVVRSPLSTASRLAEVVSLDPGLSATLLKLVNSPLYGLPSKIDSIARAIALVGSKELSLLALGVSVVSVFKGVPEDLIDMRRFWKHAIGCGVVAKLIASEMQSASQDQLFVAGLLHDVGQLVLCRLVPENMAWALEQAESRSCTVYDAELACLGFSHAEIAAELFGKWRFPKGLVEVIGHHHEPEKSDWPLVATVVQLADAITIAMDCGGCSVDKVPRLEAGTWHKTGLPLSVLMLIVKLAGKQIQEIYDIFLGSENLI